MSPVSTLCTVTPSEGETCLTVPWAEQERDDGGGAAGVV